MSGPSAGTARFGGRHRLPQRHGGDARRRHADRRGLLRRQQGQAQRAQQAAEEETAAERHLREVA
ncbi:hypothetical protein AB0C69_40370, partial [Actinomadura sp. NPDC048032]|uniref:hypothetical protein n=1 Tax=Actinomadura sp. NPDC048032 TaxID=3155747 RepID=UPI0034085473